MKNILPRKPAQDGGITHCHPPPPQLTKICGIVEIDFSIKLQMLMRLEADKEVMQLNT